VKRLLVTVTFAVAATLVAAGVAATAPGAKGGTARGKEAASAAAAALFAQAEEAFTALKSDARAQRQHQNFMRVLDAYRAVFEKHPATRQAELSLLRAGELYALLYRWTGQEGDLTRAQNYYQRLIQSYPRSSLVDDARLAIAYLHLDHFKNPAVAWLRFRDVVALSPDGDSVPEAKRQLRRLSRYAQPDPPPSPAVELPDPACPTPAAAAPKTAGAPESAGAAPARAEGQAAAQLNRVSEIRHWSNPEYTRVVISLERETHFFSNLLEDRSGGGKPPRIYLDLFTTRIEERFCKPIEVNDGILLGIRAGQFTAESVRIVLDIDRLRTYRVFPMQNPFRIVVDVTGGEPPPIAAEPVPELAPLPPLFGGDGGQPATGAGEPPVRPQDAAAAPATAAATAAAPAAIPGGAPPQPAPPPVAPAKPASPAPAAGSAKPAPAVTRAPAPPPAAAKLSLARQLGLGVRRVVIDAGHGAHDPGAPGIDGLQEKDVTLDVALRLRTLLEAEGYETVLTRDRDVYLPLEERTAIANTSRGDLFISVHCNASDAGNLSGIETYYLNLASSRRAMATAARENSMALANMSDLQHLLKEIYTSKMDESSRFADAVQRTLHGTLRRKYADVKDLGVKQAPFYVLIGAQMPSILAEISFINHRTEGKRLAQTAYRQLVAQALADGVRRYVRTVKSAAAAAPTRPTP
jgi:N-acetylmuramoyl-L-alanine amidase